MTNKYLEKVAQMIKLKEVPRSERAAKKPRRIKKPKLKKFHVNMSSSKYK